MFVGRIFAATNRRATDCVEYLQGGTKEILFGRQQITQYTVQERNEFYTIMCSL